MSDEQNKKQSISFSFRKGVTAPFMFKGHQIVVHNASFSPREKIWVDDQLVVNRWSLSMKSTQIIEVEGDQLVITYGITEGWKAFEVLVKVGDDTVHHASHQYRTEKASSISIIVSLLLGGLVGFFGVQLISGLF